MYPSIRSPSSPVTNLVPQRYRKAAEDYFDRSLHHCKHTYKWESLSIIIELRLLTQTSEKVMVDTVSWPRGSITRDTDRLRCWIGLVLHKDIRHQSQATTVSS